MLFYARKNNLTQIDKSIIHENHTKVDLTNENRAAFYVYACIVEIRIRRFYKYLLEILDECTGTTQRACVESWVERECKDELTMHRYHRLYTGCVECLLLRRTKRSLYGSNPVFCSIAIKPLAPEPGGPHPLVCFWTPIYA